MDIQHNWDNWNQKEPELDKLFSQTGLKRIHTSNPLASLRKMLLANIIWGFAICLLYVYVLIQFPLWPVRVALLITLGFTVWAIQTALQLYLNIRPKMNTQNNLLSEMERHHLTFTNWMKTQQRVALFIYPVAATGGFLLGGVLGSGKTIEAFLSKPVIVLALIITLIVLVPAYYYFAKWMFRISFGKHLDRLEENIRLLKNG
jgi:hypothetical protein